MLKGYSSLSVVYTKRAADSLASAFGV